MKKKNAQGHLKEQSEKFWHSVRHCFWLLQNKFGINIYVYYLRAFKDLQEKSKTLWEDSQDKSRSGVNEGNIWSVYLFLQSKWHILMIKTIVL